MDLACSFEVGSDISLTWGEATDIVGIHEDCVIGVDLARGVTMLVVLGRVFTYVSCIDTYSPSKVCGSKLGSHSSSFINYPVTHAKLAIH